MLRNYNIEERFWLWMNKSIGDNVKAFDALIEHYGSASEVFRHAENKKLRSVAGVRGDVIDRLTEHASERLIDDFITSLDEKKVLAVTRISDDYPYLLSEIYDPPSVLYYRGRMQRDFVLPLAMIGSRECSTSSLQLARLLAHYLAERGATIVSGMALGIDGAASWGALDSLTNEMPTIAVLGSGVDVIYPFKNTSLYHKIVERGCVISEYAPGAPVAKIKFPKRNRIISGLSKGVIVVEAGAKSGTNITVNFALEQGRDVFSLPGRMNDEKCLGSNKLIQDNVAKPVFRINDILEEYGMECNPEEQAAIHARIKQGSKRKMLLPHGKANDEPPRKQQRTVVPQKEQSKESHDGKENKRLPQISGEQKIIYELLADGEKTFDEMCEITGYAAGFLNNLLTEMEISQIILQSAGRLYSLR